MLGEISGDMGLQGAISQTTSVTSIRPVQTSPPTGEELAKPVDSSQVNDYQYENPLWCSVTRLCSAKVFTPVCGLSR